MVRDPDRARVLRDLGCRLVRSDLSSTAELTGLLKGADGLVHAAGSYRIGIRASERPAMEDANVGSTARTLDAAITAGVPRIVHVSTVNAFGDTHGKVVDETTARPPGRVPELVRRYRSTAPTWSPRRGSRRGADRHRHARPVSVRGPNDQRSRGRRPDRARSDGSLRYLALTEMSGCSSSTSTTFADGIVAALDRGRSGEAYVLDARRAA